MAIEIRKEAEKELIASIRRYFQERLDLEIGDLKAKLLLDYLLEELGPTVYNQAIADVQSVLADRIADLEGTLGEAELPYWKKKEP